MDVKIIDRPIPICRSEYDQLIEKICAKMNSYDAFSSLYQMGSIRNPGISDLDLICVFRNGSTCDYNASIDLVGNEKAILTHSLFGVPESSLQNCINYGYITNLRFLTGNNHKVDLSKKGNISLQLSRQIGMEYLFIFYISLSEQLFHGVLKQRAFLLQAKAIAFDLKLLGLTGGELFDLVDTVTRLRDDWFQSYPSDKDFKGLVIDFRNELIKVLHKAVMEFGFHLPKESIMITKNIKVSKADSFEIKSMGVGLPKIFNIFGAHYYKVRQKLIKRVYNTPFILAGNNVVLQKRNQFYQKLYLNHKSSYPFFMPLMTAISLWK